MRRILPLTLTLLIPALAACSQSSDQPQRDPGSTTPGYERAESNSSVLRDTLQPVRIGESGPSFSACNARGRLRGQAGAQAVPVRAAPFEQAEQVDALSYGAEFFICSRSLDHRWLGIIYDEGGTAGARCGVSGRGEVRRDYEGPCESGWVPNALVRLIAGMPQPADAVQEAIE